MGRDIYHAIQAHILIATFTIPNGVVIVRKFTHFASGIVVTHLKSPWCTYIYALSYPTTGPPGKEIGGGVSLPMPSVAEDLGGGGREVVEVDVNVLTFTEAFRCRVREAC